MGEMQAFMLLTGGCVPRTLRDVFLSARRLVIAGLMAACVVAVMGWRNPADAARTITLGPSDAFAAGQPIVTVEVFRDAAGAESLGPSPAAQSFVLDTGANGILMDGSAFASVSSQGYQTVAVYDEQGVAGFTAMDVSEAYRLDFAGSSGAPLTIQDARILSNPELDFGGLAGFFGLVGMPGMVGRNVTLDLAGNWSSVGGELGLGTLSPPTTFSAAPPPGAGHRYHIPLRMQDFPLAGQRNPNDPTPTWAPLPFAPVVLRNGDHVFTGEMLVDTGAQMSILSTQTAIALGLDENGNGSLRDEAIDFFPVGGVGGVVEMPILPTASLAVRTEEGVNLEWTELIVGVLDIDESIPGIFGMNFFTEGWTAKILNDITCELFPEFCDPNSPIGYLNQVNFDFRDYENLRGTMIFDVAPELDVLPLAGDVNGDGLVDIADIEPLVLALTNAGLYDARFPDQNRFVAADVNGDGLVNHLDLDAMAGLLSGQRSVNTPEPSTLALLLAACASSWVASRIRRRGRLAGD